LIAGDHRVMKRKTLKSSSTRIRLGRYRRGDGRSGDLLISDFLRERVAL
jgi:hypothetical protein